MTELSSRGRLPEIKRAEKALYDPNIVWHSLNGFDFGACIGIMVKGIEPELRGFESRKVVPLILSPVDKEAREHLAFDHHVGHSICFPVKKPPANTRLAEDVIESTDSIPRQTIKAVMVPQYLAEEATGQLPILDPFSLGKTTLFLTRQADGLDYLKLGYGTGIRGQTEDLKKYYKRFYNNREARKKAASEINSFVLWQYEATFGQILGKAKPTLKEAVGYLAAQHGLDLLVLPKDFGNNS